MKKFLISLAVAALALPTFAQSAPARLAVIDVNKVLMNSTAGKAAYEKLKKMQDDRVAQAKKLDDEIAALDKEINEKKLTLSEDKLNDMNKRLNDKKIAMQRFAQDADRDIGEARDKALSDLEAKIKPVIDAVGKEMGLAAIFNKFESGLVYASDAIDITDTVVKRFNDMQAGAGAAPAAAPAAAKKQ
jgi:outer membrane protein